MAAELSCNACRTRVPLPSMRYSKDGAGLICESCYSKQNGGINLKITPQSFSRPVDNIPRKKVVYTCKTCRYKFSRGLDFRGPRLCPNCGKGDIIYNLPNDADELLRELDRMDDV